MTSVDIRADMHDKIKVIHNRADEILEQVKKTNGRVSDLEEWKAQLVGGAKITGLLGTLFAFALKMGWIILN
jgi:hypothetical protein